MSSINKVILMGYAGKDAEIRYYNDKQAYTQFSLATHRTFYRQKGGTPTEQTDWHRIVVFGEAAITASERVHKGSRLFIEGRLSTRQFKDKNNLQVTITEVVAERIEYLDLPERSDATGGDNRPHA